MFRELLLFNCDCSIIISLYISLYYYKIFMYFISEKNLLNIPMYLFLKVLMNDGEFVQDF